jgi:hypothetical protein
VVDVDVDLVGDIDCRLAPTEAELATEEEQEDKNDDDQEDDREHPATASTVAGFDYGRAVNVVTIIIGHGNSPCAHLLTWRNERSFVPGVPHDRGAEMRRSAAIIASVLAIAACNRTTDRQANIGAANDAAPIENPPSNEVAAAVPPEPGSPGGLPDDRTPLAEPKGAIDPKSAEAAGQVVQHYGALIEQKRFDEAEKLWGDAAGAHSFTTSLAGYSEVHLQIGKPGDSEGAAGSIYITVPVVLYGTAKAGASFNRKADVILRRVNDVPGSTEAQRRWHIERIDLAAKGP